MSARPTVGPSVPMRPDSGLVSFDPAIFATHFDRKPFKVRHQLANHPLLQVPRLVRLARDLGGPIMYFRGDHSINQVDGEAPMGKTNLIDRKLAAPAWTPAETVERIESCNAWMHLRDVGADPEYAALLADLIEAFRPAAERLAPGLSAPRADIFVSSPGAVTPCHLDEEHNFLLQIRGSKRLSIFDGFDPAVLPAAGLRAFFLGGGELVRYAPELEPYAHHFELLAGEGVHIPPCFPHWVQNGPEVSVSFGVLWFSDVIVRRRHLYRINHLLERCGLRPPPPGTQPRVDALKTLPVVVKRRFTRWIGRRTAARSATSG